MNIFKATFEETHLCYSGAYVASVEHCDFLVALKAFFDLVIRHPKLFRGDDLEWVWVVGLWRCGISSWVGLLSSGVGIDRLTLLECVHVLEDTGDVVGALLECVCPGSARWWWLEERKGPRWNELTLWWAVKLKSLGVEIWEVWVGACLNMGDALYWFS